MEKKYKVNFHIYEQCNMKCKHCFRQNKETFLTKSWKKIIFNLKESNLIDEINIVGGEPTLNKELLIEILKYCKTLGVKTSIVTNGVLLAKDEKYLEQVLTYISCLGVSVDSLDKNINHKIGRVSADGTTLTSKDLLFLNKKCIDFYKKFKVNITVNKLNINDKSLEFLKTLKVDKLKLFKVQKNNNDFGYVSDDEFKKYVDWIKSLNISANIIIEHDMNDSYLMIDPKGFISINNNESFDFLEDTKILLKLIRKLEKSFNYQRRIN